MCNIRRMKSAYLLRCLANLLCLLFVSASIAAEPTANRDAQTVLNEMRLKKWTKDLSLTADQQTKFRVILDEEGKQSAKINGDTSIGVNERRAKMNELRDASYSKMRPLLTDAQLSNFEKLVAKTQPKKKQP